MKRRILVLPVFGFLLVCGTTAFPLDMTLSSWTKGTIPLGHHVNIVQISTPYGNGVSVNTSGYPGAFEFNYGFFAYYNEQFIVPPSGRVVVEGDFMYDDVTPHLDRKHLAVYLLRSDLLGYIANITHVLDYEWGHMPGVWYHRQVVFSGLEPGEEFILAFGRGDLCDMDRGLQASWADIDVVACRILNVPSQFETIQVAVSEALPGDIIQVASGTYNEHVVVDKDNLEIIGEGGGTTIIDVSMENGSEEAAICITGRDAHVSGFKVVGRPQVNGIAIHGKNAVILECNVMNSNIGTSLFANNVEVMRSNVHDNLQGIWMQNSVENCVIYYNNFFNNTVNAFCEQPSGLNAWHNGYAGNFWSNYTGVDTDGDGIGDDPCMIDSNNVDYYPLMNPYMCGDVDHNGLIEIEDISFVARRFGCKRTDPPWNSHADVNEDGLIDMRDVSITAKGFGQKC